MWIVVHTLKDNEPLRTLVNTDRIESVFRENGKTKVWLTNDSCYHVTESLSDLAQLLGAVELGSARVAARLKSVYGAMALAGPLCPTAKGGNDGA
jgi:hypothetical protein